MLLSPEDELLDDDEDEESDPELCEPDLTGAFLWMAVASFKDRPVGCLPPGPLASSALEGGGVDEVLVSSELEEL